MSIESILGIISSLIAIGGVLFAVYKTIKKRPLTELMNELADKNTTVKRQQAILRKINKFLLLSGHKLSSGYIQNFHSNGRGKIAIFRDICNENEIEPTPEMCMKLLGFDDKEFRKEWIAKHTNASKTEQPTNTATADNVSHPEKSSGEKIVYLSALMKTKFPQCCNRLTDILAKHNIPFAFLEGTKDIWCRDYMPIQTPSGKLIQFKYDPSYLREKPEYIELRSDVKKVCEVNGIKPIFSDINLDGGNVVMYQNKAIITDRIFSENPTCPKEKLIEELARLLECEIIIIPAYKPEYDFTGHADGMMRFIDSNTVLVNNLDNDFKYMRDKIQEALNGAKLKHINLPFFDYKIKGNSDHAIGLYINYLEVNNLIVMPVFGCPGNKDSEALATLKSAFPDKIIETIDYNDVALEGGVLNCTTWVVNKID